MQLFTNPYSLKDFSTSWPHYVSLKLFCSSQETCTNAPERIIPDIFKIVYLESNMSSLKFVTHCNLLSRLSHFDHLRYSLNIKYTINYKFVLE